MLVSISAEDFPISDLSDVVLTIKHGQQETQLHLSDFTLVTDPDTHLDLGGIAKGFIADRVGEVFF